MIPNSLLSNVHLPPVYFILTGKVVLDSFLYSNSKAFLDVIKRWSGVTPPLFNHAVVLQRLQNRKGNLGNNSVGAGKENLRVQKWDLVEAKAQLHILAKQHEEALNCYLEMNIAHTAENNDENDLDNSINATGSNDNSMDNPNGVPLSAGRVQKHTYRHVFELIEREVRPPSYSSSSSLLLTPLVSPFLPSPLLPCHTKLISILYPP
jgi:hypothetical protein